MYSFKIFYFNAATILNLATVRSMSKNEYILQQGNIIPASTLCVRFVNDSIYSNDAHAVEEI
jgi:hypothetical protein